MSQFKYNTPNPSHIDPTQVADSARVVSSKGYWSVYLRCGEREWPLILGQNIRIFRHFESVVVQLKNRGVNQFQVDIEHDQAADKEVIINPLRPKVLQRASTAEAYDAWFRVQVKDSLVTPLAPLSEQVVRQNMAEFKAQFQAETLGVST